MNAEKVPRLYLCTAMVIRRWSYDTIFRTKRPILFLAQNDSDKATINNNYKFLYFSVAAKRAAMTPGSIAE